MDAITTSVVSGFSIGVVLVNYKGAADTFECIDSLEASDWPRLRVYVVDNASADGIGEALSDRRAVKVIELHENVGFGAANNVGFGQAFADGCDAVLALNNDTVVDRGMISALAAHVDGKTVVVPLMLYHDQPDLVWYGGGAFDRLCIPHHEHMRERISDVKWREREVMFVTGCCFLVTRAVWERIGGFDDAYFLYWEDVDLSIRWKQSGVRMFFVPEAKLWHKVSSSTGGEGSPLSYYYNLRNWLYTMDKYHVDFLSRLRPRLTVLKGLLVPHKHDYALKAWRDYRAGRMGKGL